MPRHQLHSTVHRSYQYLVIGFMVLVGVLILAIAYLSLAQATVRVRLATVREEQELFLPVSENPDAKSVYGRLLTEEASGQLTAEATAQANANPTYGGPVTITSRYGKPQTLVKTTRLLSPTGLIFRLQQTVTVPANGQVSATALADKPGGTYALGPTSFTIPGLWEALRPLITAGNAETFTQQISDEGQVTATDIAQAQERLSDQLADQAEEQMNAKLLTGETLLSSSREQEVLRQRVDAKPGDRRTRFTVLQTVRVTAMSVRTEEVQAKAEQMLRDQLGGNRRVVNVETASLEARLVRQEGTGRPLLAVRLAAQTISSQSGTLLDRASLRGLSDDQVAAKFRALPEVAEVQVDLWPFFVWRVPWLADHIRIELAQ